MENKKLEKKEMEKKLQEEKKAPKDQVSTELDDEALDNVSGGVTQSRNEDKYSDSVHSVPKNHLLR